VKGIRIIGCTIFSICFYYSYLAHIFYYQLESERIKILIPIFFVAFFAFAYNTLFGQGLFFLQTYTMVIGVIPISGLIYA
jgi:hypothetical protein